MYSQNKGNKTSQQPKTPQSQFKDICVICQCPIAVTTIRGQISNCNHNQFCLECIKEWAQKQNTCPLCMKRFNEIIPVHPKNKSCRKSQQQVLEVSNHNLTSPEFGLEICEVCHNSIELDVLYHCCECEKTYHQNCFINQVLPIRHRQNEDWIDMINTGHGMCIDCFLQEAPSLIQLRGDPFFDRLPLPPFLDLGQRQPIIAGPILRPINNQQLLEEFQRMVNEDRNQRNQGIQQQQQNFQQFNLGPIRGMAIRIDMNRQPGQPQQLQQQQSLQQLQLQQQQQLQQQNLNLNEIYSQASSESLFNNSSPSIFSPTPSSLYESDSYASSSQFSIQ